MRSVLISTALVATIAASDLLVHSAGAQELQLGRPAAPDLTQDSLLHELASQLEEETALLVAASEGESDSLLRAVLEARANIRGLTRALLEAAISTGPEGSVAGLIAITLLHGQEEIDRALSPDRWPPGFAPLLPSQEDAPADAPDRYCDAYWSLIRFNEIARRGLFDPIPLDPDALDAACRQALGPLRDALEALENRLAVSHWIPMDGLSTGYADSQDPRMATISTSPLGERLAMADLPEESRVILFEINAMLDQASDFPEFKRQAAAYRQHIEHAISFAEAVAAADWILPEERDQALARLHASVVLFEDKETRRAGEQQLARLIETADFIRRLNELSALPRHRLRPTALLDVFLDAQDLLADPARADAAREHLIRLQGILDRMIGWRRMREPQIRRELKVVCANLDRMYEQAEGRLLEALASNGGARIGGDPNLLALLSNHAQILIDLDHVQAIPKWTESVKAMRPEAAERFEASARRIAGELIDPARRAEAVGEMNRLATWMSMLFPMPFEAELRAGTAETAAITSGQHHAMLAQAERARIEWIDALAEGNSEPATNEKASHYHRLLSALSWMADYSRDGNENVSLLNRWAAWELEAEVIQQGLGEAQNRIRLACQAAAGGDVLDLQRQLGLLETEATLPLLIARLGANARPLLPDIPVGALGTVEEVAPPDIAASGWLGERRKELAVICRYAMEADWARARGRTEIADACDRFVNAVARDLLSELDSRR
jgi:hypothetical protein